MKWLLILASIAKPLFFNDQRPVINPAEEFKTIVAQNAMKLFLLLIAIVSLGIMFAAGIVIIALDMGAQVDQTGTVFFSSILVAGLILCTISLLTVSIVVYAINNKTNPPIKHDVPLRNIGTAHPIQDAVALLIADFVKEREFKRTQYDSSYSHLSNDRSRESDSRAYYRH